MISIIAILTSLLLPSLRQAREQGRSIACRGNLKQIGSALLNYSTDFNDNIMYAATPYTAYWNGTKSNRPWFELLGNLGPYSELDYVVKIGCLNNKNTSYKRNILCPSQTISDSTFAYSDYAANMWFFGSLTASTYKNHSFKLMQRPTDVALITDNGRGNDYSVSYPYSTTNTTYDGYMIRSNHAGNTANFLFGDMHVSHISRERIGISGSISSDSILIQGFISSQGN